MNRNYFTNEIIKIWEEGYDDDLLIEGTCFYNDGNEEYLTLKIDSSKHDISSDYPYWRMKIEKIILEIIAFHFEEGDHAVTLESTTNGNDSIICLITACK